MLVRWSRNKKNHNLHPAQVSTYIFFEKVLFVRFFLAWLFKESKVHAMTYEAVT